MARSTFRSQNAQNTPFSDHFWKLRCRKSARRCGAKHISKSKCTKHTILGPLLEVETSKKCTPLWREAHFEVKMYKTPHVRATFGGSDVEKVHAVVARSTFEIKTHKTPHVRATFGRSDVEKVHAVVARSIVKCYPGNPNRPFKRALSSTVPLLCALRIWNPSLYIGSILESHEHRVAILPKRIKHLD